MNGSDDAAAGRPVADIRVLLLNATHEPLAVLPARRALVLVLTDRAECLSLRPEELMFRSPTTRLPVPAVVRLHRYVRVPRITALTPTRSGVLRRDRRRCAYCEGPGDTVDHVVPRSKGGITSWENCVACCVRCNSRKGDRLLSELGWSLSVQPRAPRRIGALRVWWIDDPDPEWQPWLSAA